MPSSPFIRPNWPALIPRIVTPDDDALVAFVKHVFHATGDPQPGRPTELWIGESVLIISDGGGERAPSAAFLYVYVPDADATYARAIAAGARSLEAPQDMPYGDRRAMVEDRWGNTWQIATYRNRP
jgi:predicted enzyme related to lactoylglutathione lyase